MNSTHRIATIDVVRGIGIFLVVVGHSGIPDFMQWWIWSFHMPLFFVISGAVYDQAKYQSFIHLIKTKFRTLLRPYLIFSLLFLLFDWLGNRENGLDIFLENLRCGWISRALWFIPVLFITELAAFWTLDFRRKYARLFIFVSSALIGYCLFKAGLHFPYKLDVVFTALPFFGLGLIGKKLLVHKINLSASTVGVIVLMLALLNVTACFLNQSRLDLAFNVLGDLGLSYVSAVSGTLCVYFFAKYLIESKLPISRTFQDICIFFGSNSLIILALHQELKVRLQLLFGYINLGSISITILRHIVFWIALLALIEIFRKYFYWILGKRSLKPASKYSA